MTGANPNGGANPHGGANPQQPQAPTFAFDLPDGWKKLPPQQFRDANISCTQDIRGKGLMIGMTLQEHRSAKDVMTACMDCGVIVCIAQNNVLRIAPPLTIKEDLLQKGLEIIISVLKG